MTDLLLYNARIFNNINNIILIKNNIITDLLYLDKNSQSYKKDLNKLINFSKNHLDVNNKWITAGLIDCHTHLIFAGDRQQEFTARLSGVSYEQIAKLGGGINFTVAQTRAASFEELLNLAKARLEQMLSNGVTTVEIKSGYGLNLDSEKKILQVAKYLAENYPVTIQKTFLGAHTVPVEFENKAAEYIDYLAHTVLPDLINNNLVDAVDSFCESIGFTAKQLRPLYNQAKKYDLLIKGHTEQLSNIGGAELICEYGGKSCDHLEYADLNIVKLLKKNKTTAVLLPGAYYYLREKQAPPIELLREHQVPMAVATDFNPGTSPNISLLNAMNMACVLYRLTPQEVWDGVTINAARALGLDDKIGSIEINKQADLIIWDCNHPYDVCYYFGYKWSKTIIKNGQIL